MTRRQLSHPTTKTAHVLKLIFFVIIFTFGIKVFFDQALLSESFLSKTYNLTWMVAWIFLCIQFIDKIWNQKQVYIEDDMIIFSNHFKEVRLKISNIAVVSEKKYVRHGLTIQLKLRIPCEFGSEISFLPFDYKKPKGGSIVTQELKSSR